MGKLRLDNKLDCKACGTIQMEIPDEPSEQTRISCTNCGAYLGTWGDLQDDFAEQIRDADFLDLNHGNITKTKS